MKIYQEIQKKSIATRSSALITRLLEFRVDGYVRSGVAGGSDDGYGDGGDTMCSNSAQAGAYRRRKLYYHANHHTYMCLNRYRPYLVYVRI